MKTFSAWTGGECEFDSCSQGNDWLTPFTTPAGSRTVDLVASVTFTYETNEGDHGFATAFLLPKGAPPEVFTELKPKEFRVESGGLRTSTTLEWFLRDLPAQGKRYSLAFTLTPRDGNSDQVSSAIATRGAVIVELSP
jgi:hypothetical protein